MLAAILTTVLFRPETTYVPAQTLVLVLAPVDASGDKQAATSTEELAEAKATLENTFSGRGFVVVSDADAATAATTAGIDLTVKANRTAANIAKIGAAANARLVAFTAIEKTGQKIKDHFLSSRVEGYASVQTWLLDVQDGTAFLKGETKGVDTEHIDKGENNRQVRAVRLALDDQLRDFVKPYPEVKK